MEEKINNRYHSKAITIRGTTYPSQQAAAEALGVSFHAVHIAKKRGRLDFLGIGRGGLQSALQELISENAKLRADLAKAVEALEEIMVGGNHLAVWLPDNHPPADVEPLVALEKIGAGVSYDVWCCWRSIMLARTTLAELKG